MSLDDAIPTRFWNDERIETLKRLHAEGKSFGVIAAELGITRNSAISKAQRVGLVSRVAVPARVKPKSEQKPRATGSTLAMFVHKVNTAKPVAFRAAPVADEPPPATRCSLVELTREACRFPIDVPGEPGFFFCGDPSADFDAGRPYCVAHAARAYVTPRRWP